MSCAIGNTVHVNKVFKDFFMCIYRGRALYEGKPVEGEIFYIMKTFCILTVQAREAATRVLLVIYLPTFCDLFSCFHVFGTNSGILTFL